MVALNDLVPKDLEGNLEWRLKVRERASGDREFCQDMLIACKNDILFWMNTFGWLFEPRADNKIIPFITWPHQDNAVQVIDEHLGHCDIGVEKARGEGASWIAVYFAMHRWIFDEMSAVGLVSRNENAVDSADDPDSLMWKIDWALKKMPPWMIPEGYSHKTHRNYTRHTIKNPKDGGTIAGYAAVGDVASGGRKTCFVMDELAKFPRPADEEAMASTQHVTESRLVISTPKGAEGAYYECMREADDSSMKKVILDWRDNPTRNVGLYRLVEGKCVAVDPVNNPLPEDYQEKFDSGIRERLELRGYDLSPKVTRSPWFDAQCLRLRATPKNIAQELERSYGGSGSPYFSLQLVEKLLDETCKKPVLVGDYTWVDEENCKWIEKADGPLRLWIELIERKYPSRSVDYVAGVDVAMGAGGTMGSNSVITVAERVTGVKVAEYASPNIKPEELARLSVAICRWFKGPGGPAYLIWESNGPGVSFTSYIRDHTNFRNIYERETEEFKTRRRLKKWGYHNQSKARTMLFSNYAYSLAEGKFTNPSKESIDECKKYQHATGDKIIHMDAEAKKKDDPSGAGQSHGDRVIADALSCWALKDFGGGPKGKSEAKPQGREAPYGSRGWRDKDFKSREAKKDLW